MKKKSNARAGNLPVLKKSRLAMRFFLLFTFCWALSTSASAIAQDVRLSMNKHNVELVTLLNELSEKSNYEFFFNDNELAGVRVNISAEKATIREILDQALRGTAFYYRLVENVFVISPKALGKVFPWKVSGIVKDKSGETLPGVTVSLKGTTVGVVTNAQGEFKIEFPKQQDSAIIIFSFVGMKTQELMLKDSLTKNLVIIMEEEVTEMDEVVVTGFGNKSKNSFTGSAVVVKREQLLSAGTKNVLQSLQAFVPGMQLVTNNRMGSDPNTIPDILVRGRSSFEGSSNLPTFIVDGAEVDVNYIFDMDMNDVESATILKDASATALYGAKASSGVIVITTKPLAAGKLRVSYSGTLKGSFPDLRDYDLLNSREKLQYEQAAGVYSSSGKAQWELDRQYNERYQRAISGVETDWMSKGVRNAFVHNHNINIYGGDEYIRYSLGVRYGNEQGVMKESKRDRYSLSFKLSYNKGEAVFFQNTTTITSVNRVESPYGKFSEYVSLNPYDRAYNLDGTLNNNLSFGAKNPLYEASLGSFNKGEEFYIQDIFTAKFLLLPGLRTEASFSITKHKNDSEEFISPNSKKYDGKPVSERGSMKIENKKSMIYEGKLLFTYNKMLFDRLLLNATFGGNIQSSDATSNNFTGIGILSDKLDYVSFATRYENSAPGGSTALSRNIGSFITANIIYFDRYFFDFSYRYEGSSQFGKDKRFAPFWSAGIGWNIHKERFFKANSTDILKLRASVGYIGKANFDPSQALTTYQYNPSLNYNKGIGAIPITIGNTDLKWERTLNWNFGVDMTLFKNRLDLTLDYYRKITDNLLLDVAKAPSIGVETSTENVGKINNIGIDFSLRVVPIQNQNWNWALNLTMSHNKNEIKEISNALKTLNDKNNAQDSRTPQPVYVEGESLSAIKVVKSAGIDPATGSEVYVKQDGSLTFDFDYNDKRVYGDQDPKVYGTFGSYLMYKGFSLNLLFSYRLGATLYNETLVTRVEGADPKKNADKRVFTSRWQKAGDRTKYKNIADSNIPKQTSRFIEDEYRLEMTSINAGYDFKPDFLKKLHLRQLRLEFLMNDLFNLSSIKQERGLDYPFARSFEFSVRATF